MKSCRIQALIEELIIDWDKLNLAAKLLVYIGFFLIFSTVFISIYKSKNVDLYETIEAIFRTALASVFGFLLSSNIKNSSEKNSQKNKEKLLEKMTISMSNKKRNRLLLLWRRKYYSSNGSFINFSYISFNNVRIIHFWIYK